MARTKAEVMRWKLPKALPEGVSIQTQLRTLGKKPDGWKDGDPNTDTYGKDIPVNVPSVQNNAGVVFIQEQITKAGGDGEAFLVNAVNSALASIATDLTPMTVGDSLTILPTASAPRYVDRAELAGAEVKARLARGEKLSGTDIAAIYADVIA